MQRKAGFVFILQLEFWFGIKAISGKVKDFQRMWFWCRLPFLVAHPLEELQHVLMTDRSCSFCTESHFHTKWHHCAILSAVPGMIWLLELPSHRLYLTLKQIRIFFHMPNILRLLTNGVDTEMAKMPNSVMLEGIPVLDYKAAWIYWWSKRGGTKIRIN